MKNITKTLLINLGVFVILWLLLELISSQIYRHLPKRYENGKRIVELNLGHKINSTSQPFLSHPYLLYVNNPNYIDSVKQHNSFGYRSPAFTIEKDTNTIRILALGGSTTYGYLNKNPNTTWPAILQRKLQQHTPKKIEVINGGLNYATSAELLAAYVFRHRYINADIIIFHEGGNDAAAEVFPNYQAEYTHFRAQGNHIKLRAREVSLLRSYVFRTFYALWLNNNATTHSDQPYGFTKLDKEKVTSRVHNDSSYTGFRRNVELLVTLTKSDSSDIMLMGFLNAPLDHIKNTRPTLANIAEELVYATNRNNLILKDISKANQLEYVDLEDAHFETSWFIDNCHLRTAGEEKKAEIIYKRLKEWVE